MRPHKNIPSGTRKRRFCLLQTIEINAFPYRHIISYIIRVYGRSFSAGSGGGCGAHPCRRRMDSSDRRQLPAKIVLNIRLVKVVVTLLASAVLSVSGLQIQTLFCNPLEGPYVLGISADAGLGVAIVMLADIDLSIGIATATWTGSPVVLLMVAAVGQRCSEKIQFTRKSH